MWETCNNLAELSWWIRNGGDKTLESYGQKANEFSRTLPSEHLRWISDLPLLHADRHRVFVHAAVDPMLPLSQQNVQTLLWGRYQKDSEEGHGNRHVVHGHHAHIDAPIVTKGRTNLDGMAWKTGKLIVGVFEDDRPGGASEFIEILGAADR
jgi:serine/threonine protein phosphatase 1